MGNNLKIVCTHWWLLQSFEIEQRLKGHLKQSRWFQLYPLCLEFIIVWYGPRDHLNIKSPGNYSGIHPSLITPEGGHRGNAVKMIVEEINRLRHGGWRGFAHPQPRVTFFFPFYVVQTDKHVLLSLIISRIYCVQIPVIREVGFRILIRLGLRTVWRSSEVWHNCVYILIPFT